MALYDFEHIRTGEIQTVFFRMNDEKIYCGPNNDQKGEWRRIFTVPNAAIDCKIDPYSKTEFVEKTRNKKGSVGDLMDESARLSKIRAEKNGQDPIKEGFLKKYKKDTGKDYKSLDKNKTIEGKGFKVDFGAS